MMSGFSLRAIYRWNTKYKKLFENWTPILNFHKIDDQKEWGINSISPSKFREFLNYLKQNDYKTITLKDYFVLLENKSLTRKHVVLCFDDGYADFAETAVPIMEEFGFTATAFIITDYIGKYNNWDFQIGGHKFRHMDINQIKDISERGFEIGSHTCSHPDLRLLNDSEIKDEIQISYDMLSSYGINTEFFSYPFGLYNQRIKDIAIESGYKGAVAYYVHDRHPVKADRFALERIGINSLDNLESFKIKLNSDHPMFPAMYMFGRTLSSISLLTPLLLKQKRSPNYI